MFAPHRKKRSHQLRYVLRNKTTKQVYLVILFTLYLNEDVNEDGSLKPEAVSASGSKSPAAALQEQAVIANEEDAQEPDFDGEAALEAARRHLSDVDLSQKGGAAAADDDVD